MEGIVRFVRFHSMQSREDLFPAETKIEEFLTHLTLETKSPLDDFGHLARRRRARIHERAREGP